MDTSFWHRKWEEGEIGFHESDINKLLVSYLHHLSLVKSDRVFVPLCGKTLVISWLLANGYRVAGAELSRIAIEQLFAELGVRPEISAVGLMDRYSAPNIDIFVGDIFDLSSEMLGPVDAVFDRAALVALPDKMRNRYAAHLTKITGMAPQLLICYEYDQSLMAGPPFSVSNEEVRRHYGDYDLALILSTDLPGGLKGVCSAMENLWLLKK
ncbi:MAG: thiopurine S-methyltransferase [Candidatus Nitrotoga sp.]|nr:thiopurine S-methyltransferase [Candidatus Nitrotoga sp.]MBP0116957.1 thiopurine S-methyltransferase [Candidatus Nitrotoga sp.]MBP0123008.1 thiopurine S-methyltransferase [Candidatus Nitrotoga sp.]MBP0126323.1 thiopurine S-methyltransferase [Candidatus Nitrotoga sp.]